jgi:hypothetical protein
VLPLLFLLGVPGVLPLKNKPHKCKEIISKSTAFCQTPLENKIIGKLLALFEKAFNSEYLIF